MFCKVCNESFIVDPPHKIYCSIKCRNKSAWLVRKGKYASGAAKKRTKHMIEDKYNNLLSSHNKIIKLRLMFEKGFPKLMDVFEVIK